MEPRNDSATVRVRRRSKSVNSVSSRVLSSNGAISVAESIVHRETAAVVCCDEKIVENLAISCSLAVSVSKKAFAFVVQVADSEGHSAGERLGQGGFIRCRLPTLPGSPPLAKRRKVLDAYRPAPAIKQTPSVSRASVIPVTALHNVVNDVILGEQYNVMSIPLIANPAGVSKHCEFKRLGGAYGPKKQISFPGANSFWWKYGKDVTTGDLVRKVTRTETDPILSFDAVGSSFEYKVGQKIGMAVYRNYEFDFTKDSAYNFYGWNKNITKEEILQIFGPDYAVSVYTGEITAVSLDKEVFRHSINTFGGCSGAIVFLLDKNQDHSVAVEDYGKAIGIHAGAFDEITTTTKADRTNSQSRTEPFNIAFAIAGLADKVAGIAQEHPEGKANPKS